MAGSKKRKEPAQSSTLLDFFATPTPSAKKTRCGSTSTIVPTKKRVPSPIPEPEDVIVISDDDQEVKDPGSMLVDGNNATDMKNDSSFGMPTFLLEDNSEPRQCRDILSTDAYVESFSNETHKNVTSKNTEARYGEWGMGDDEAMFQDAADEDDDDSEVVEVEEVNTSLCQGSYDTNDTVCPVCGKMLNGLFVSEVENHVNGCLDALSSMSLPDVKNKPLSTVQAPTLSLVTSASTPPKSSTAFSVLMSSHKENNAWKEASQAESQKFVRGRRPAPFYKVMQGMPIAVDAFRYGKIPGVTAYFLTHAHSDHYTNLSSSWKHGAIYCSQTTANLITHMLGVDPIWVFPLPMDIPTVVPNTGGVEVTLIPANHCPGSVLFLFKGQQTVTAGDSTYRSPFVGSQRVFRYLHCGDFRACPQHVLHAEVKGKKIDAVYLDTTYLDPKYCFPPQSAVISACAELAFRIVRGDNPPGGMNGSEEKSFKGQNHLTDWVTKKDKGKAKESVQDEHALVVVGTYSIGKERIVKAIAQALSTKVYCDPRKKAILKCLSDDELHDLLTDDPFDAGVHLVPLHVITSDNFRDYLSRWKGHWTKVVGFRPTGWTYTSQTGADTVPNISHVIAREQARTFTHAHLRQMRSSTPTLMLYGVPYSEHSSFFELTCFALSLDWVKMIATVNVGSAKSRGAMGKWFEKWRAERIKRSKLGGELDVVQYRQEDYW